MAISDDRIERIRARILQAPEPPGDLSRFNAPGAVARGGREQVTQAAVLIGLVQRRDDISVLYTERSAKLRAHSGQVSFPGGRMDDTDRDVAHTALREAEEEVALNPSHAEILGYMPNFFSHTNYLITPVVAAVYPDDPFVPNPGEVASVFELPLPMIADEKSYAPEVLTGSGQKFNTWRIGHAGPTVWGMTAFLTRQFRDRALHDGDVW